MSGYIIEEPEDCPVFYNTTTNEEITEYWRLYSPIQRKRFKAVLRQMNETWYSIYNIINTFRNMGVCDVDRSNEFMLKIHRMFIVEHRHKTEYYNEEKLRLRKQKGYLTKKINKLRKSKSKI